MASASLSPDQLELVHRYVDGELSTSDAARVEVLLREDPLAREVVDQLRSIERSARNEVLAASSREDFSNWWDAVEQQMIYPSLEPPPGVDPVRPSTAAEPVAELGTPRLRWPLIAAGLMAAVAAAAGLVLLLDLV